MRYTDMNILPARAGMIALNSANFLKSPFDRQVAPIAQEAARTHRASTQGWKE